ncbi:MAG: MFS transporter [Deltaproteobacteria bacterium]|nr:MFS transporter [Deltaproteobacteria bacterium]
MGEPISSARWLIAAILFLANFTGGISLGCLPPLFLEISNQIPLTKAQMGTVMGGFFLSAILFAPIGGITSDKIGCRWATAVGILIAATAGALRAYVGTPMGLIVCGFFLGAGMYIVAANIPKVLGILFPPDQLAFTNGLCLAGLMLGMAVGTAISVSLLSPMLGGWRGVVRVAGGCYLLIGIIWVLCYKDPFVAGSVEEKTQSPLEILKRVSKVKGVWLLALFLGVGSLGSMSLMTFLPISFQERGFERAGELASIGIATSVVFNILGGLISDKLGMRKSLLIWGTVASGLCVFTFSALSGIPLVVLLLINGACAGAVMPILFVMPVEMEDIGPELAATATGFIFMLQSVGGFIGPLVCGMLVDVTGNYLTGFLFMGAAIVFSSAFVIPIKETGERSRRHVMTAPTLESKTPSGA